MGRRRWKFITIAAFLLFIKDAKCQDENDFYYTPVERSYAQVQPPLFANNRPATYFEHGDNFRVPQSSQQPLYNEGNIRFPSPNYNQNPTPFQLPTGKSQSENQFYLNEQNYSPTQRQRFRPALPHNYQIVHPASTKRPDASQIHSVAYQNDPSKPETFLGQITLNNPDIDYLQNSRFKNIPFDGNSLKSNGQSGHILHEDFDTGDFFDHPRVTTYNPYKLNNKQIVNVKPNTMRFPSFDENQNYPNNRIRIPSSNIKQQKTATENKALLELEPLLEDDIGDIRSFKELMKNNADVQVIKSNKSNEFDSIYDSKPDASSMNADNIPQVGNSRLTSKQQLTTSTSTTSTTTTTSTTPKDNLSSHEQNQSEEEVDNEEYVEYYDDTDGSEGPNTTPQAHSEEPVTDIYDDYDATEESEKTNEDIKSNVTDSYDILVMKPNTTTVKDDNFKHFVDTTVIDQTEKVVTRESITTNSQEDIASDEDVTSIETPSILGQEVVSVVTTKSVVNGTISIPVVTFAPSTPISVSVANSIISNDNLSSVTTENWRVVASVQTSRSVSGARFLPFPPVEQDDKKQVLMEDDVDSQETVTVDPKSEIHSHSTNSSTSTENINDKLDSIQSELSSAVLSGSLEDSNKNIELITESTTETTTISTTPSSLNVFTLKMTTPAGVTEKFAPDPLPVLIKKFIPRVSTSTTSKPKKKPSLVTVMDDLAGFLPPGYKPRQSFKDKRLSTTTTTTTTTTKPELSTEDTIINGTQARSSGISSKNKVIVLDDKSLLPKEFKPKAIKPQEELFKKSGNNNLSKLLPPGYKPPATEEPGSKEVPTIDIFEKVQKIDISAFLPKGFNASPTIVKSKSKTPALATPVDISAFLPPGFKLNSTEEEDVPIKAIKVTDISNLLPPGFTLNNTEEPVTPSATTKPQGGIKLVFPSRPGSKPARKEIISKPVGGVGPSQVTPKIQKGWPTRASTEFTGWPSPSTTPFSIEKLLEAQRNATATSPMSDLSTEVSVRRTTTTTTTTQAPPPSTTPGVCRKECDIAATINIVAGVKWVPELLDHHTEEWKKLARDVKEELNSVYSKSGFLNKWYKGLRVDEFTPGDAKDIRKRSVYVDYVIELNDIEEKVDTMQLKKLFHKSLYEASPGSVVDSVSSENEENFDPDVMVGDQPEEERMRKSNEKMTKTIDKSAGKLEIGKFVMDPAYTEFIVLPKREEPKHKDLDEESFLPQWGIAVIVITMASLLFVVIFGVTVLVNRQKSAKAKQPIPLSEDMLRELDKSHMGGFDDVHQMKERDLPYLPSGKRMSTAFIEQLAYPNPGDSWRSEWTPQLQKYMQHYTPDSGRGSQIYGPGGNAYGYGGGSQLYGQTGGGSQIYGQTGGGSQGYGQTGGGSQHYGQTGGGGGSQLYGYTGEYPPPRTHYSRRRSDYDSNF